jgi:hypothetical protein
MRQQISYIDWDFNEIWAIDPGINTGYPYLLDNLPPSVPSPSEAIPIAAPILTKSSAGCFTAGPNPVGSDDAINFFWDGGEIKSGRLSVYNSSGNIVSVINIRDVKSSGDVNCQIGSWNLTDRRSRKVPAGTYLVRGVIVTDDGVRERVSVVVGIRN